MIFNCSEKIIKTTYTTLTMMGKQRSSGVLLHISSLPSKYGIGDFGNAPKFIDFLKYSGQKYWQILPMGPTDPAHFFSPYTIFSTFALNPLFIDPEIFVQQNLITKNKLKTIILPEGKIQYEVMADNKENIFRTAFQKFQKTVNKNNKFKLFCKKQQKWLDDYALFIALGLFFKKPWYQWESLFAARDKKTLLIYKQKLSSEITYQKFLQFYAFEQWSAVRKYAKKKQIKIIGDMPIFVAHNSADVWVNAHEFKLDQNYNMQMIAGVPPDLFNAQGQCWNLPIYNWEVMQKNNYSWWRKRVAHALTLFDYIRLDHFRGFEAHFDIPAGESAAKGQWVKGPGFKLFEALKGKKKSLSLIAEDLGIITDEVNNLRREIGIPGMKVVLVGFMDYDIEYHKGCSIHHIEKHTPDNVVYSTTHDFNTAMGWYQDNASGEAQNYFRWKIGNSESANLHWDFINHVASSVGGLVILQMQDVLGLSSSARMNTPGTSGVAVNWTWRVTTPELTPELLNKLRLITNNNQRF